MARRRDREVRDGVGWAGHGRLRREGDLAVRLERVSE